MSFDNITTSLESQGFREFQRDQEWTGRRAEMRLGDAVLVTSEDRRKAARSPSFPALRLSDIQKVAAGRPRPLNIEEFEPYAEAAAPWISELARGARKAPDLRGWCRRYVPELDAAHDDDWFASVLDNAPPAKSVRSGDAIAKALMIRSHEVTAFGLRTCGSSDRPKHVRRRERKEKDRLAQKARRAKNGATPREQSLSSMKPWKALNLSRAKFYELGLHRGR